MNGSLRALALFLILLAHPIPADGTDDPPRAPLSKRAARTKEFNKWMRSWSPINQKIKVADVPGMGRGVIATRDVQLGERILSVPLKYVLCRETIMRTLDPSWRAAAGQLAEGELLMAYLLQQRALGEASLLRRWIAVMPRWFPTPVAWAAEDVRRLEVPHAEQRLRLLQQQAETDYVALLNRFLTRVLSASDIARAYTYAHFLWARGVVTTRAWNMHGRQYLVPVAGMFNHAPDAEDRAFRWQTATGQRSMKFLTYHRFETATGRPVQLPESSPKMDDKVFAVVLSDRSCKAGDQVFESYGDNDNAIYLDYHGFVPDWNPYECVKVFQLPFDQVSPASQQGGTSYSRYTFLQRLQLPDPQPPPGSNPLLCLHEGELSDPLLAYFAVARLDDRGLAQCRAATSPAALLACGGARDVLPTAHRDIAAWVDEELRRFSTTLEEDAALLAGDDLSEPARAAVRYRHTHKVILHSIRALATQRAADADVSSPPNPPAIRPDGEL
eukprot:EG_transcript_7025